VDDRLAAVTQERSPTLARQLPRVPARLVRFDYEGTRLAAHRYTGSVDAPFKFADAFPLLVTNTASLAE